MAEGSISKFIKFQRRICHRTPREREKEETNEGRKKTIKPLSDGATSIFEQAGRETESASTRTGIKRTRELHVNSVVFNFQ